MILDTSNNVCDRAGGAGRLALGGGGTNNRKSGNEAGTPRSGEGGTDPRSLATDLEVEMIDALDPLRVLVGVGGSTGPPPPLPSISASVGNERAEVDAASGFRAYSLNLPRGEGVLSGTAECERRCVGRPPEWGDAGVGARPVRPSEEALVLLLAVATELRLVLPLSPAQTSGTGGRHFPPPFLSGDDGGRVLVAETGYRT